MELKKHAEFILKKYKIDPNVTLDQHFMIDSKIIEKIVKKANLKPNDTVLEIGSGIGFISREIADTGCKLITVEIDKSLVDTLKKEMKSYNNVKIVNDNVLKVIDNLEFDKIVSNTPYAICESLIHKLTRKKFKIAVLTVPKSFGYKLLSDGHLAAFSQVFFQTKMLFDLEKDVFYPKPKKNSVVISLKPRLGNTFLKQIFLLEKKKLKNSLLETIIYKDKITKNEAREKLRNLKFNGKILDKKISDINLKELAYIIKHIKDSEIGG
ncbi:MAG: rRNA adenine dimethyltransferase family protein [Candidatus Aenigmatarchaeota archaeon]